MGSPDQTSVNHFWVASHPFFESTLFLCPLPGQTESTQTHIELFDADGNLVNRLSVAPPSGHPTLLELDPMMEGCKFESGLRHGHLIISTPPSIGVSCRFHNRGGASMAAKLNVVTHDSAAFSPIALGPDRSVLVAVINMGANEASLRCRLMLSNRNPDALCNVPAHGARLICVEKEFREALLSGFGRRRNDKGDELTETIPEVRAYLRLASRNDQQLGVQYLEGVDRGEMGMVFSALSA